MSLEGKIIVVTGAAGGIGAASVAALRRDGAAVIEADLVSGPDQHLDAADPESWRRLVAPLGRIDGLLNAAGSPTGHVSAMSVKPRAR